LYVNENTEHKMRGDVPMFVVSVNCVYYELKSSILVSVNILFVIGSNVYS